MDIQEIFGIQMRSLPYTTKFVSNNDAEAMLYVAASVTPMGSAGEVGINVKVDGQQIATLSVFSNEVGSSRPLVAQLARFKGGIGEHTVTLEKMNDRTTCGAFDYACGTVFYRGFVEPFIWRFKGPVPQYTKFKSQMLGQAVIFFSGSGFLQSPQVCGLSVVLDGNEVARSQMLPGIGNSHFAFPQQFVPVMLKPKEYQIGISTTIGEVKSDGNDNFEVAVFY